MPIVFFLPSICFAQSGKKDSLWLPLKPLIGYWSGEGGGEPGQGRYARSYQFIMNNNFIEVRNKSTYPPTRKNPAGEVHEDIGYFSYDSGIKKFRLRQFHIEGFVNEFVLESISADKKTIVFITESIENISQGYRAKETYHFHGEDELEEMFEIAAPGKEFAVYSRVKLTRKK